MTDSEIYLLLLFLLVLMVYAVSQIVVANRIAKSSVIRNYLETIYVENMGTFIPSQRDVLDLQRRLKVEYRGKHFNQYTIRQAITFSSKSNINRVNDVRINNMKNIDLMSGEEFERYLKKVFENQGFRVNLTPHSGDQGVDLILYKDNRKIAIQAKRNNQNSRVGNSAIQEVNTGKIFYDCNESWVITTSHFTNQAITLANKVEVRLIDRNLLMRIINNNL
ncbi:restriction endonuclease [Neobacillus sp. CF12]|uniref:restriction endonuclease n=1 Tax=Neobacillus sp. CF12 TaxID=3055864 RepID=UPI0025A2C822|nr:restriction endonuclease [Neobacillus sp. CF12]MDM5326832.1 restriction endonuclease [Neobacillus sp. CF12]